MKSTRRRFFSLASHVLAVDDDQPPTIAYEGCRYHSFSPSQR